MMEQNKIDYKKFAAQIYLDYGVNLDENSISFINIIITQMKHEMTGQNKRLDTAIDRIKISQKTLEVDKEHPKTQAFAYGFGKWGFGLCLAVILVTIICCVHDNNNNTINNLNRQIEWYKNYRNLMQNSTKENFNTFIHKYPNPEKY